MLSISEANELNHLQTLRGFFSGVPTPMRVGKSVWTSTPAEEGISAWVNPDPKEAEKSEELTSAQDVLAEMRIANKHATEAETLPQLKIALETGKRQA